MSVGLGRGLRSKLRLGKLEVVLEMTPAGIDLEALYAARFFVCRVCGDFGIQWADAQ